jgi:uncharacterized protein (TIGR02246 family)
MPLPVEDQLAIHKLMADYNFASDIGDGEAWADLFVEDGVLDTGMGMVAEGGRKALVDFGNTVPKLAPGCRHLISNVSVDGSGDEATARVYMQMWMTSAQPGETKLAFSGVYDDVLRKVDGQWKFVKRVVTPDRGGPIPQRG